jgi:hypothetical protein
MNSVRSIYFKHTWTGRSVCLDINIGIQINEFKNTINQRIMESLMVNNDYKIIIAGQELQEMAEPIDLASTNQLKSLDWGAFYIRPTDEPIPQSFLNRLNGMGTQRVSSDRSVGFTEFVGYAGSTGFIGYAGSTGSVGNTGTIVLNLHPVNLTNLECGICFQNYSLNNFLPWNNCSHYTSCCRTCISVWSDDCIRRSLSPSCPICRRGI